MKRIAAPAVTVMIAVAAMVAAGAWNRSGDPQLAIALTERELPLTPFPAATPGEDDPGLRLRIAWEVREDPLDTRNWLPESRLRELGFVFNTPVGAPGAADAYARVPPRLAWVAFEYDGPAWREIERRRALREELEPRHFAMMRSRLVPVDAAAQLETLRVRYPSGHLILRAVIGLTYIPPENGGPLVHGRLREAIPQTVAVPGHLREVFDSAGVRSEGGQTRPRYEAELAIGRLGLPYLRAVRAIE